MITIRLAKTEDLDKIVALQKNPEIYDLIGAPGQWHPNKFRDETYQKIQKHIKIPQIGTVWVALIDSEIVGFSMIESRKQAHEMKNGVIGVHPGYRRRRVATALLFTQMVQAFLEGRRYFSDTIVGYNRPNQKVLQSLGFNLEGTLHEKTASFKDIKLFGYRVNKDWFATPFSRLPKNFEFEVFAGGMYVEDLWKKNMTILENRGLYDVARKFNELSKAVQSMSNLNRAPTRVPDRKFTIEQYLKP